MSGGRQEFRFNQQGIDQRAALRWRRQVRSQTMILRDSTVDYTDRPFADSPLYELRTFLRRFSGTQRALMASMVVGIIAGVSVEKLRRP